MPVDNPLLTWLCQYEFMSSVEANHNLRIQQANNQASVSSNNDDSYASSDDVSDTLGRIGNLQAAVTDQPSQNATGTQAIGPKAGNDLEQIFLAKKKLVEDLATRLNQSVPEITKQNVDDLLNELLETAKQTMSKEELTDVFAERMAGANDAQIGCIMDLAKQHLDKDSQQDAMVNGLSRRDYKEETSFI
jgi:hypothetical protein